MDKLESRLRLQLATDQGKVLFESDNMLKDYTWGMRQIEGGFYQFDIYDRKSAHLDIITGENLKLSFSYSGDLTLTLVAKLLVICRPK